MSLDFLVFFNDALSATYMIYLRKRGWLPIGKRRTARNINNRGFLYVITPAFALTLILLMWRI
jgi:hypothetical protein